MSNSIYSTYLQSRHSTSESTAVGDSKRISNLQPPRVRVQGVRLPYSLFSPIAPPFSLHGPRVNI